MSALLLGVSAPPASGQLSEPCQVTCALVLSAAGFTTATGAAVAVGRWSGGISTVEKGLWIWGTTFAVVVGGGLALGGDGELQERAVYSAGVGALVGAVAGLGIERALSGGDGPRSVAATLVGAAAGALAGGVYGALSHANGGTEVALLRARIPL
jgi:hypothetical protein